jgi:hypothetical protein
VNDDDAIYLSLVLGLWFHTRALVGKPSAAEAMGTLKAGGFWTKSEREELVCRLAALGQIGDATETRRVMWDDVPRGALAA